MDPSQMSGGRRTARRRAARALGLAAAALLLCTTPAWASHNVYADNGSVDPPTDAGIGSIQPFSILGDGSLTALGDPVDSQDAGPAGMVVSPDNRHVYVVNSGRYFYAGTRELPQGSLSTFAIAGDGTLTPQGSPLSTGDLEPGAVAITPDGRELFVTNAWGEGGGSIQPYAIGSDGTPTPVGATVASQGYWASGVAVSPDGHHLYVVNQNAPDSETGNVAAYTINADGTLTPLSSSPVATKGSISMSISVAPDGSHVYVGNEGDADVTVFSVGSDGSLTQQGDNVSTGGFLLTSVVVAPDGRHLYATDGISDDVAVFTIAADGSLTLDGTTPTDGVFPTWASVSPDGNHLYASLTNVVTAAPTRAGASALPKGNSPLGTVETFAIDRTTGALTEVGSPASTNGRFPQTVVVSPDQGPVAAFSAAPGVAGSATGFNGGSSTDVDGSVVRWDWSFGDGSSAVNGGPTPSHVYAAPGTYTVTLTVTDDAGCSLNVTSFGQMAYCNGGPAARTTRTVTVAAPAPPVVAPSIRLALRLHVNPTRVFVHTRRCFRFTVTTAAGQRVPGATVHFRGHGRRTNRRGQTTICSRLPHTGRFGARATYPGTTSARAHVRAVRRPAPPRPHFTG